MVPGSHREAKKEACRQAIARAAVELFEEKGFDATTMDEIAVAARVSRPTVFNYFARKEEILTLLAATQAERLIARLQALEAGAPEGRSPLEALRELLIAMAEAFAEYPETSRAIHFLRMQESRLRRGPHRGEDESDRPVPEQLVMVARLVERAQARGELRADFTAVELAWHLLIGLFSSTIGPWLHCAYGKEPLAAVVARHFELYLDGMRSG